MSKRKQNLLAIFSKINLLCRDIDFLILEYDVREWEISARDKWKIFENPTGISCYDQYIYTCSNQYVSVYNKHRQKFPFEHPIATAIDIDEKKKLLYIVNRSRVWTKSLHLVDSDHWHRCWDLSRPRASNGPRAMKIDNKDLYLSVPCLNQILVCHSRDGLILNKFYIKGPEGITVYQSHLYVCDSNDHRVQVLEKKNGNFVHQWGGGESSKYGHFLQPMCIYYDDAIFFVGDACSVQLFTEDGMCLQRLGDEDDFYQIRGLCVFNEQLYVIDWPRNRILIFHGN